MKKTTAGSKVVKATPMPKLASTKESVRIEKIENGYLAHHNDANYNTKTVFHPENPLSPPKKKGK